MGRWSKARHAEEAAKAANKAAQEVAKNSEPTEPQIPEPDEKDAPSSRATPSKNPRNEMLEKLALERGPKEEKEPEAPPVEAKPEAKAPETPPESPPVTPPAAPETPSEIKMVKVKVDGEESEVPQTEIDAAGGVHAYQRDKASENRLKKANEVLAEARRLHESAPKTPPQPQISDEQFIASKMQAVRFGSDEEAAKAMGEIMARAQSRVAPPENVITMAVIQNQRMTAVNRFKEEFSDVSSNPLLYKLAQTLEAESMTQVPRNNIAELQGFDWNTFYRRIGNQIRSVVGKPSQATPPTTTPSTPSLASDKEARKASIVNLPAAAARAEPPKEPKQETREDILQEMRKSRGLL